MSDGLVTGTILDRILARTVSDLRERAALTPLRVIERRAAERHAPVSLQQALQGPGVSIIAEIKRASPSRGVFPVTVEAAAVAAAYLDGGASAISVLTDEPFFHGSLADLAAAARVAHERPAPAPVLRKDFVLDPYQIVEARANGADAVLLIVAALDDHTLADLLARTTDLEMDALVEVHDEHEVRRALTAGASIIGINNRDLRTFEIDLAVTERLVRMVPAGTTIVGESGIFSVADVARLGRAGVDAVLVGESLILSPDRAAAVRALRPRTD